MILKSFFAKFLGLTLIIAAILGIALSAAGIVFTIRIEPRVSRSVSSLLDLLDRTLSTTQSGLDMAGSALDGSVSALESLQTTVDSVGRVVDGTLPTLNSISELLGTKLPGTIRSTRQALTSAETAAKNVDSFLSTLSKIPVIGTVIYNPEKPLNKSIGDINNSLKDAPGALTTSEKNVDQMIGGLESIQADMDNVSKSVSDITNSARDARRVVQDYQNLVNDLQSQVDRLQQRAPVWLRVASWGVVLLFVWMAIAQIALAMQGFELLGRKMTVERIETSQGKEQ